MFFRNKKLTPHLESEAPTITVTRAEFIDAIVVELSSYFEWTQFEDSILLDGPDLAARAYEKIAAEQCTPSGIKDRRDA